MRYFQERRDLVDGSKGDYVIAALLAFEPGVCYNQASTDYRQNGMLATLSRNAHPDVRSMVAKFVGVVLFWRA